MLWGRELARGKGPEASVIGIERLPDHLVHSLVVRRGHTGIGLPGGSVVKNLPANQETWVRSLDQEDPLR